ncbi:hypothetical protein OBBRIDRAFT_891800 [Obba rivulosa]|uniref:Zn(2)-C6 fungal-type domain-containing protein n=1 Tax=Obba rivulosa TaxID=1052685 RepID=A0A8E2DEZ6_9APHY|nr:hypothetical protein OBBRIDRAFT_891800 [Obba rivulosa]
MLTVIEVSARHDSCSARKRRNNAEAVNRSPEGDHRRKRRNRTTQSCLHCHTSKRMCDRKRPCGRCMQLGLTGLCVYEVDDPSKSSESQDEKTRLLTRIAELENVIRELKNKPHPRWVSSENGIAEKSPSNYTNQTQSPKKTDPDLPLTITLPSDSETNPAIMSNGSPFSDSISSSYGHSDLSTPPPPSVPFPLLPSLLHTTRIPRFLHCRKDLIFHFA